MNKNPIENIIKDDEKAYIVIMKKQEKSEEINEKEKSFIIGGFKNGKILDEYYISENNGEFINVSKYKDIVISEGNNNIKLSLNGTDVISSIEIKFK